MLINGKLFTHGLKKTSVNNCLAELVAVSIGPIERFAVSQKWLSIGFVRDL